MSFRFRNTLTSRLQKHLFKGMRRDLPNVIVGTIGVWSWQVRLVLLLSTFSSLKKEVSSSNSGIVA
jgi:hypothetical protein